MTRKIAPCVMALLAAAALHAQDTTIKQETHIKADDAKVMTVDGCLSGAGSSFILTNAVAATIAGDKKDEKKTVGTSGVVASYALVPRDGVSLAPHVGHRVELVGVVVDAAKKGGDDDAKVKIDDKTKVKRDDAPDTKSETTTKAQIARGPNAQFAVTSLKMISPVCIE